MMVPRQTAVGRLGSLGPALEVGRPWADTGSPSSRLGMRMSARSGVRQKDMMGTWLLCSDSGSSAAFKGRSTGGRATSRHSACRTHVGLSFRLVSWLGWCREHCAWRHNVLQPFHHQACCMHAD